MENTEAATLLQQLKALAVQLHIDDRYGLFLPELPAPFPYRYVKEIDRSFVNIWELVMKIQKSDNYYPHFNLVWL